MSLVSLVIPNFVGLIAGFFQHWVVGYLRDFSAFQQLSLFLVFWAVRGLLLFASFYPLSLFAAWVAFIGL